MKVKVVAIVSTCVVFSTLFVLLIGRVFSFELRTTDIAIAQKKELGFDDTVSLSQSFNNCAPYSASAMIQMTKTRIVDPEYLSAETGWRIGKGQTLPFGLLDLLKKYKVNVHEISFGSLADNSKLVSLREIINGGRPIILLGKIHNVQHYLTIVGYDREHFYVYNSLQPRKEPMSRRSIDGNGNIKGNQTLSNQEILDFWSGGGKWIFFRYWGIVGGLREER